MSFFNTMFIQNLFDTDLQIIHQPRPGQIFISNKLKQRNKAKKSNSTISKPYSFSVLLIAKNEISLKFNYKVTEFADQKLKSRNFIMNLLNKYWQETIFLSKSSTISDHYISQIKSDGISIYKNQYKKFLLEFSKALIEGRIKASLDTIKNMENISIQSTDIKYIWSKGINFSLPQNFLGLIFNKRQPRFPNKSQKLLIKTLQENKIPLFTTTNIFNQIIIAEPSDELINSRSMLNRVYQWYYNNFIWQKDQMPMYEGLFFINPEDALEYQQYVQQKYDYNKEHNHLNIFTSSLDFYYRLVRTSPPRVQFRLIPDLKELGDLVCKYQFYKTISFHKNQKYGKNYFQGQPIYLIQPILTKNKDKRVSINLAYFYELNQASNGEKYNTIFLNYKVALLAWRNFVKKQINYNLPNTPQILVYNLEDFLKECEQNYSTDKGKVLMIPNKESYHFIKSNHKKQPVSYLSKIILHKFLSLKIITRRIIWSLTSRQPINW